MRSPLAIVTRGLLGGGGGSVTVLQGGTEVEASLDLIEIDIELTEDELAVTLDQITVDVGDEPDGMEAQSGEIAVEA